MKGICSICNKEGDVYYTFGKYKCRECIEKSKTGRVGHSGMIYHQDIDISEYLISCKDLCLIRVKKSNKLFVKWFIEHYPQSKGIVGRQLNYLVYNNGEPIGIIGFASPPLNYKKFNNYFEFNENLQASENAKKFLNNNVFRIVHTEKNLGTRILKLARNQVYTDYKTTYNENLLGLVTFVERPRSGAMYKADNWDYIGDTQGVEVKRRGKDWADKKYIATGNKKLIFGYKYKHSN